MPPKGQSSPEHRHASRGWRGPQWAAYDRRGERPSWWPEEEAWPPRRRHGPGGFGCLFGLVSLALFAGLIAIVTSLIGALGLAASASPLQVLLGFVVLFVVLGIVGRTLGGGLWRTGRTLDTLVEGARRVEDGDYSVRVGPVTRGPRGVRELARAFDTMVDRLEADERQRQGLLADVSHELRTPLAVIRGSIEAIIDGVHPADSRHLGAIVDETRVMERLVEDLRTLALAESGTLTLHRETIDLGGLLREVAASFRAAAASADVSLRATAPEGVLLADVDPVRIREVVANLLDNAIRHTPSGGRVDLRVGGGSDLTIQVADTGPGIDPATLPHVFDRFVKGPGSQGSGLGLAIARDLVVAHGGTIGVASQPLAGSTFTVTLPVAEPRPATDA